VEGSGRNSFVVACRNLFGGGTKNHKISTTTTHAKIQTSYLYETSQNFTIWANWFGRNNVIHIKLKLILMNPNNVNTNLNKTRECTKTYKYGEGANASSDILQV